MGRIEMRWWAKRLQAEIQRAFVWGAAGVMLASCAVDPLRPRGFTITKPGVYSISPSESVELTTQQDRFQVIRHLGDREIGFSSREWRVMSGWFGYAEGGDFWLFDGRRLWLMRVAGTRTESFGPVWFPGGIPSRVEGRLPREVRQSLRVFRLPKGADPTKVAR
jgi:hypothetical protein